MDLILFIFALAITFVLGTIYGFILRGSPNRNYPNQPEVIPEAINEKSLNCVLCYNSFVSRDVIRKLDCCDQLIHYRELLVWQNKSIRCPYCSEENFTFSRFYL